MAETNAFREIRALYDDATITVYQAYSAEIAIPAVVGQSLAASTEFKMDRMTWIKPSFMWMMYRSGFSYKDSRQAHILALRLRRTVFEDLLSKSRVNGGGAPVPISDPEDRVNTVRVQWDPERSVRLEKLPIRSLQMGIGRGLVGQYLQGIVEIEDVTDKARQMKSFLDAGRVEEARLLLPVERVYPLTENLRAVLGIDV